MKVSATKLRQNLYAILDEVLATGQPVEIERKGRVLRLVLAEPPSRLARLKNRNSVVGDLDSLVHLDWSMEWSELK
ncbi:MAG: type II toxin-antitoxin system Phd/YefM family antitoxin [Acidobacteriota bacterium]